MRVIALFVALILASCVQIKEVAVFDGKSNQVEPHGFNGFYSTNVFDDYITQEIWFTQSERCLKVETSKEVKFSGEASLHLKWDKISQSCEWLGIGIGWDAWNGKDLSNIVNTAAIEMKVRNANGKRVGLPLAGCLEDYSNGQAWIGFSANAILADEIGEDWVTVRLPLSEFEWDAVNGANPGNIKQFIIQFEADGDIYLDDIKVVEFNGSFRKRASVKLSNSQIKVDGKIESSWGASVAKLGDDEIYLQVEKDSLCIAAIINDKSPLQNSNNGDKIWDGDALEIAFSSAPVVGKPSPYYKSTNHHIGFKLNNVPTIWDWQKNAAVNGLVDLKSEGNKVVLEAKIPLSYFGNFAFNVGQLYGLEMAIDKGNDKGREQQLRWNSRDNDGFHENPSLWGEMIFINAIN